jgi:hypothetical protein
MVLSEMETGLRFIWVKGEGMSGRQMIDATGSVSLTSIFSRVLGDGDQADFPISFLVVRRVHVRDQSHHLPQLTDRVRPRRQCKSPPMIALLFQRYVRWLRRRKDQLRGGMEYAVKVAALASIPLETAILAAIGESPPKSSLSRS